MPNTSLKEQRTIIETTHQLSKVVKSLGLNPNMPRKITDQEYHQLAAIMLEFKSRTQLPHLFFDLLQSDIAKNPKLLHSHPQKETLAVVIDAARRWEEWDDTDQVRPEVLMSGNCAEKADYIVMLHAITQAIFMWFREYGS